MIEPPANQPTDLLTLVDAIADSGVPLEELTSATPETTMDAAPFQLVATKKPSELDRQEIKNDPMDPLLNLFSPMALADALEANEWNLQEELAIVTEIAKGLNPKATPSHQLAAADYLRRRALEVLRLAGRVGVQKLQAVGEGPGSTTVTLTTQTTALLGAGSTATTAALTTPVSGFALDQTGLLTYQGDNLNASAHPDQPSESPESRTSLHRGDSRHCDPVGAPSETSGDGTPETVTEASDPTETNDFQGFNPGGCGPDDSTDDPDDFVGDNY